MEFLTTRTHVKPHAHNYEDFWTDEQSEGVLELFHRNYWKRVWIIQEFLLAKRATIYCEVK
jgi:hypothetical protein